MSYSTVHIVISYVQSHMSCLIKFIMHIYMTKNTRTNCHISLYLVVVPAIGFGFPFSIRLDLSASFVIFESLTSYVSFLMLLMRGYSLKCTYNIPKFSIFL